MPYTNNTPQATQTIAFTQPLIEDNFGYIAAEQRVNHTWTDNSGSNAIAGEADGSHQELNMPNQLADITGALPTGIAAIMYAKGGNLYTWNGAKRPVSGISTSGTVTLQPSGSIGSVADDCIGFVMVKANNAIVDFSITLGFFAIGGTVYFQQAVTAVGSQTVVSLSAVGTALTLTAASNYSTTNTPYKLIYWPI